MKARGSINGIWLVQADGVLHPAIQDNLSNYLNDASANGFDVNLWSNLSELSPEEANSARELGISLYDHSLCAQSRFYPYFTKFLKLGIAGDKTAFALASDILRMAILEITPQDQYYIYADPNDIHLLDLNNDLKNLDGKFETNPLGFSFYVAPINKTRFQFRNDVLIARKENNKLFFNAYFDAYLHHLEKASCDYHKPLTDGEAQAFANKITDQTASDFFQISLTKPVETVAAKFIKFDSPYTLMHSSNFLSYMRNNKNANTWLPEGKLLEEKAAMGKLGFKSLNENISDEDTSDEDIFERLLDLSDSEFLEESLTLLRRMMDIKLETIMIGRTIDPIFWPTINMDHRKSTENEMDFVNIVLLLLQEKESVIFKKVTILLSILNDPHLGKNLLTQPPDVKLITYPEWEKVKSSTPKPDVSLRFLSMFDNSRKEFLVKHRHDNAALQHEYDKNFGLILKK